MGNQVDIEPDMSIETAEIQKEYCRGNGIIVTKGIVKGQLKFRFSSDTHSAIVECKDLLGRNVMELSIHEDKLDAIDVLNSRHYTQEQLISILPILEVFSPINLHTALWGYEPNVPDTTLKKYLSELDYDFKSVDNEDLIHRIKAVDRSLSQTMIIDIVNREFGLIYPDQELKLTHDK